MLHQLFRSPRQPFPIEVIADPLAGGVVSDQYRSVGFYSSGFGYLPWLWEPAGALRFERWEIHFVAVDLKHLRGESLLLLDPATKRFRLGEAYCGFVNAAVLFQCISAVRGSALFLALGL